MFSWFLVRKIMKSKLIWNKIPLHYTTEYGGLFGTKALKWLFFDTEKSMS